MKNVTSLIELFYRLPYPILASLPLNFLSRMSGIMTDHPASRRMIPWFVKAYGVDLEEAEYEIREYATFNDFFMRRLKKGAREIDRSGENAIAPADGTLSYSRITDGRIWAVKGKTYSLERLLDEEDVERFQGGHAVTIYLSPSDYHRFHMPVKGRLTAPAKRVPGFLFSVLPKVRERIDQLFCVNERLIFPFSSGLFGDFYLVAVGATFVGSILNLAAENDNHTGDTIEKGDELGAFKFGGSSVALITEQRFPISLAREGEYISGRRIRFGDLI